MGARDRAKGSVIRQYIVGVQCLGFQLYSFVCVDGIYGAFFFAGKESGGHCILALLQPYRIYTLRPQEPSAFFRTSVVSVVRRRLYVLRRFRFLRTLLPVKVRVLLVYLTRANGRPSDELGR